jgi:hypothetical protein
VPSYTDRILFHSLADVRTSLSLLAYELCDTLTGSDHRPVSAAFELKLNKKVGREGGREGGRDQHSPLIFPCSFPIHRTVPPSLPPSLPQVIGFRTLPSLRADSSSSLLLNASSFRGGIQSIRAQFSSYLEGAKEEGGEEEEEGKKKHLSSPVAPPAPLLGTITPASEVRRKEIRNAHAFLLLQTHPSHPPSLPPSPASSSSPLPPCGASVCPALPMTLGRTWRLLWVGQVAPRGAPGTS